MPDPAPHAPRQAGITDRNTTLGTLMLAPAIIYIVALVGIPLLLAIGLSVSNATVGDPGFHTFVGLDNFKRVLADPAFPVALRNSIIVTLATLIVTIITRTDEMRFYPRTSTGVCDFEQ